MPRFGVMREFSPERQKRGRIFADCRPFCRAAGKGWFIIALIDKNHFVQLSILLYARAWEIFDKFVGDSPLFLA